MASVKIIHYTQKVYSNGTSPVILQIIQGKSIKRKVIASVLPEQWNDKDKRVKPKKHPNYAIINNNLSDEFNRIEGLLLKNPNAQVELLFPKEDMPPVDTLTFWKIADIYLQTLVLKSGWTYLTFRGIINKFSRSVNNPGLLLSEISQRHLQKYLNDMQEAKNGERTIYNNFKVLRFVNEFGQRNKYDARSEDLQDFKVPTGGKSLKIKLTTEELSALATYELKPGTKLSEIRDMFMLAVYLRGIRISDVIQLKHSYIVGGRLIYNSGKTGKDFNIKLIPEALTILSRYQNNREYIFSFYDFKPDPSKSQTENELARVVILKNITANINNKLKKIAEKAGIKKNISTHIARHTFARMALDKIKDSNITMDLLGHSSMKVHEAYIREISQDDELDAAADSIFS